MTQDLELRVLNGLHQGAGCMIQDGALIGSHERCDVILRDDGIAPEAGRLEMGAGTWRIATQVEGSDHAPQVPYGTPLRIGPVLVTIAYSVDPWPDPAQLPDMLVTANPSRDGSACDAGPDQNIANEPQASGLVRDARDQRSQGGPNRPSRSDQDSPRAQPSRPRKGMGLRWAVGGLLILLVFGSVASFPPARVQSSLQTQTGLTADADILLRAQHLLLEQGYADRVHASLSAEREIVVTGWVGDELEYDRLATALSAIWPLPALRVGNKTQVAARIRAAVQDLDMHVAVDYPGTGRLTIRGVAASEAVQSEAYRRWREASGALEQNTMELLLAANVADALNKAMAAAGLPAVESAWKDKALRIDSRGFEPSQRNRLKTILDTLNASYMDVLTLDGETASLPFRVHTVVGGRQPWVVLEDGTRIVVGGQHGAYRLTSIEDGKVIFDGPAKTVIQR